MRAWPIFLLLGLTRANADPAVTSRLEFVRASGSCGDERILRAGVTQRLGRDPFREDAPGAIAVRFAQGAEGLVATVQFGRARRTLRSPGGECPELARAVELAVSLAVDPLFDPDTPPPAEAVPARAPRPRAVLSEIIVTDEELPVERPHRSGPWHIGVGSYATFGQAPTLVVGVRVELGLRTRLVSLTLEPWLTLPAATAAPGGDLRMTTLGASLVGCHAVAFLWACGEVAGGAFQAVGEGDGFIERSRATSPLFAFGARVLWTAEVLPGLDLRLYLDGLAPILRTRIYSDTSVGRVEAWSTPILLPSLGFSVVGHFG